jgi:DNA-binding transcriptional ArsR family regulator
MAVKPENIVRRPDVRIVRLLVGLAASFNKHYCFPSQATICELLWRFHKVRMSRRNLNRHLLALQLAGYIRRTRRPPSNKDRRERRGNAYHSTLYSIAARYFSEMRGAIQKLEKIARRLAGLDTGIRVPRAAQYARDYLKLLYSGGRLSTGSSPPGS